MARIWPPAKMSDAHLYLRRAQILADLLAPADLTELILVAEMARVPA